MSGDANMLRQLLARPIAFHPALSRLVGKATAGLFLSQMVYWSERRSHPDGWVYKSWKEWERETTLSEDEQRTARKLLENLGLIQIDYAFKHFPDKFSKFEKDFCYRVNFEQLFSCLSHVNAAQSPVVSEGENFPPRETENPTSAPEISHFVEGNSDVHTTKTTESKTTTTMATGNSGGGSVDIEELIEALVWELKKAGRTIKSRGGWESKIRNDKKNNGFSGADLATLRDFREAQVLLLKTVAGGDAVRSNRFNDLKQREQMRLAQASANPSADMLVIERIREQLNGR
jgi:hypothetical protein